MITLECGTSASIELKNPIFGDKRNFDNHKIVNKSMYDYKTFTKNAETGEFISLSYTFETMSQYDEFLIFLRDVNGLQVHLTAHDGAEYDGVVVGPFTFEVTHDGTFTNGQVQNKCTTNWSFTFEVEMILS